MPAGPGVRVDTAHRGGRPRPRGVRQPHREADGPRAGPRRGHRPAAAGAGRDGDRRRPDDAAVPPVRRAERRVPRRRARRRAGSTTHWDGDAARAAARRARAARRGLAAMDDDLAHPRATRRVARRRRRVPRRRPLRGGGALAAGGTDAATDRWPTLTRSRAGRRDDDRDRRSASDAVRARAAEDDARRSARRPRPARRGIRDRRRAAVLVAPRHRRTGLSLRKDTPWSTASRATSSSCPLDGARHRLRRRRRPSRRSSSSRRGRGRGRPRPRGPRRRVPLRGRGGARAAGLRCASGRPAAGRRPAVPGRSRSGRSSRAASSRSPSRRATRSTAGPAAARRRGDEDAERAPGAAGWHHRPCRGRGRRHRRDRRPPGRDRVGSRQEARWATRRRAAGQGAEAGDRRRALAGDHPRQGRRRLRRSAARPSPPPPSCPSRDVYTAGRPRRPRPRRRDLGLPGRVPVHPGRPGDDVPVPLLDDAPVRGLRDRRRDQRALPLPARRRARPACRSPSTCPTQMGFDSDAPEAEGEVGRVGVPISSLADMETLFARDPAGRGQHVDDDQRHGADPARPVRGGRRAPGRRRGRRCPGPPRTTSSRSTSPGGRGSTRRGPRCAS